MLTEKSSFFHVWPTTIHKECSWNEIYVFNSTFTEIFLTYRADKSMFVYVMAWHRADDKPLPEPTATQHISPECFYRLNTISRCHWLTFVLLEVVLNCVIFVSGFNGQQRFALVDTVIIGVTPGNPIWVRDEIITPKVTKPLMPHAFLKEFNSMCHLHDINCYCMHCGAVITRSVSP